MYPATLFLATGPMTNARPNWWDELADIVFDPMPLHGRLVIGEHVLPLVLDPSSPADTSTEWRAWHPPTTSRQGLYYLLWDSLRTQDPASIETAMCDLRDLRDPVETSITRPITKMEVKSLVAQGMVELGGHTVDHPDLPSLSDPIVQQQVQRGNEDVAAFAHAQRPGFAYPFERFDERTKNLVKECDVEWACTTPGGYVDATSDRFALSRMTAIDRPDLARTQYEPMKP